MAEISTPNIMKCATDLKNELLKEAHHVGCGDDSYFLTITLPPKLYKYSSITQLELTNRIVFGILHKYCKDYVCIAEHTGQGNIHYHAVVKYETKMQAIMLINSFKKNKAIGFIKHDGSTVKEPRKVAEYLTKEFITNYKILRSSGHKPDMYQTCAEYNTFCKLIGLG